VVTGSFVVTDRTRLRRLPDRGTYDRATTYAILDEALVCHVGFVAGGQPMVIPTTYGRDGDHLLIHGSAAGRLLRTVAGGVDVCVAVTLLDGVVLARSTFHHSMNYRSVVIVGRAARIDPPDEKRAALDRIVEHVVPGRTPDARPATDKELRATLVLSLPIEEASVKIRTGGPIDDDEDMDLPMWAGVVPLSVVPAAPIPDPALPRSIPPPAYATTYRRR
jgi:uncharacterized protein